MRRPVKIGIAFKLFLAILGAGIVMATAMGVANRISFQHGFLGYLNELEAQRLAVLTAALADTYREGEAAGGDGWASMRGQEDDWRRFVRASDRSFRASRYPESRSDAARRAEAAVSKETGERSLRGSKEVAERSLQGSPLAARPGAEPSAGTESAHPGPVATAAETVKRTDPLTRTTLLDADRRVVAGNPAPAGDAMFGPVVVAGQTVGWVASVPYREITNAADLRFQERQTSAAWYIAGLAVLLAGIVAWALGRVLLAPARRLADATHELAAGRYETRVAVTSSDELGRLAGDFNRLAQTLERNENARREFLADVSHELRTPLAIMRGELEAMQDGLQALDARSIESLQAEVGALAKLVDDIHQLSMAEVGALTYHRTTVDVSDLLEQNVEAFRGRLGAREIDAEVDIAARPLPIVGDADRLGQVFHNILENAVRYVDSGARLRAGCRRDGEAVEIVIEDSGPGVPDEYLDKLFDRFYRVEGSRNRATGGSGLGLAICRGIVAAHEGTLAAGRSRWGGLALTLRLPAAGATGPLKT